MENINNFETILLKNLISNGIFFNKVFSILNRKFFTSESNKKIFDLIKDYYKEYYEVPSLVEIAAKIKDVSNNELRKELALTIKSINSCDIVKNIDFLCNETLKFAKDALYLEALTIGAEGLQNKSDSLKLKAQQILDERAKLSLNENIGLDYDDTEAMIQYFSKRDVGILSQHKELNKRLGTGFLPGTLSVILAGQSVGKSLLMCDLISGMLMHNKNVLLISLEMADYEMMKRIYANTLDIDVNSFSDLAKTEGEKDQLDRDITTKDLILSRYNSLKLKGTIGKFFVKDYPTGTFSALQLESLVQKFQIERDIKFDCIFIDYLGIMKSDIISPSAGLYSYIKSIGEEVRAIAKKLNVAIISASQLNRCLDIHTKLITSNGQKELQEIQPGMQVLGYNGYRNVIAKSDNEIKKCFKITLKSGKTIVVTKDHRIPTQDGLKAIKYGLKVGDRLNTK